MATPASRWQPSLRPFRAEGKPWEYPAGMTLLRVQKKGYLLWNRRRWAIGRALRGQVVGLLRVGERVLVYFCNCPVRELDPASGASLSIPLDILTVLQYCDGKEPQIPALSQTLSR